MKLFDRFFPGEHGVSRPYLLSKAFLLLLGLDICVLMIRHAGRYGAGGFNVAHVPLFDQILPLPSPALYIAVLLLAALLALTMVFTGIRLIPAIALFLLYSYAFAMSMLDNFQHHYFIATVLFCFILFRAGPAADDGLRVAPNAGYSLLGITIAIVYTFTAIAKMDPFWMGGHTLSNIAIDSPFRFLTNTLHGLGLSRELYIPLVANLIIVQELLVAAAYVAAVQMDRWRSRRAELACFGGFLLAVILHLGTEGLSLEIGWFSIYMLALACCFLLPLAIVDRAAELLQGFSSRLQVRMPSSGSPGFRRATGILAAAVCVALLLAIGMNVDLPGAATAFAIAAASVALATGASLLPRAAFDIRPFAAATAAAAIIVWLAITATPVRWDYYRYLAGDQRQRNNPVAALEAYEKSELYAPRDSSRIAMIRTLREELGRQPP